MQRKVKCEHSVDQIEQLILPKGSYTCKMVFVKIRKPLALINGIPMIRRVYDLACQVKQLDTVVVLTDDDRIVDYCSKNEMRCIVVEDDVRSGTDRCAKALELLDGNIFVNIQGDEPLLNPDAVDRLISEHRNGVSNAYVYVNNDDKLQDKNVVKTITDMNSNAIYYSRLPIPYQQKESTPFQTTTRFVLF